MIAAYFDHICAGIAASPIVRVYSLHTEQRSDEIGFLRRDLSLGDGSCLHFREYVYQPEGAAAERYTYTHHYQRADSTLIFRPDNTPHLSCLRNSPHHKHDGDENNVAPSEAPDLVTVLEEIAARLPVE